MAKRKGKSLAELLYDKQLKRIKRFIKRAEERGYRFEGNIIPDRPQKISMRSVSKLAKLTPSTLYQKATALSDTGKVIRGTEKRKEERKASALKGAQTRKQRLQEAERRNFRFEIERAKKDAENRGRLQEEERYRKQFEQGEIVYDQIMNAIDDVEKSHKKAADHLRSVLENEISHYGKDKVMRGIANAPQEVLELAQVALHYNPGHASHDGAIRELVNVITGTIPTAEELQSLQEAIDSDMYEDNW